MAQNNLGPSGAQGPVDALEDWADVLEFLEVSAKHRYELSKRDMLDSTEGIGAYGESLILEMVKDGLRRISGVVGDAASLQQVHAAE